LHTCPSEQLPLGESPGPFPQFSVEVHIPSTQVVGDAQYPVVEYCGGGPHILFGIHFPMSGLPVIESHISLGAQDPYKFDGEHGKFCPFTQTPTALHTYPVCAHAPVKLVGEHAVTDGGGGFLL